MSLLTAVAVDCVIPRGTHKTLRFQIKDLDIGADYDLTGHSVVLRLFKSMVSKALIVEKEGTLVNASEGKVSFTFVPEDTGGLMVRSYDCGIMVIDDSNSEYWPVFEGTVAVIPSPEQAEFDEETLAQYGVEEGDPWPGTEE